MADLSRHPKAFFFFFLLAKRICVWSMYQTSLTLSLSGTKSPLTLALSKSSLATSCLANDIYPYGNGGGGGEGFRYRFGLTYTPETGRRKPAGYFYGTHAL